MTGQSPLPGPAVRIRRQTIHVALPCESCIHSGLCAIEEQVEDNLVLEVVSIGRPIALVLECSEYSPGEANRLRGRWTPERRAKFEATIAARRVDATR